MVEAYKKKIGRISVTVKQLSKAMKVTKVVLEFIGSNRVGSQIQEQTEEEERNMRNKARELESERIEGDDEEEREVTALDRNSETERKSGGG